MTAGQLRASHLLVLACACLVATLASAQPLPSWNEGPAKSAILRFVAATTTAASPDFVPPERRIAVFDNDGTLWVEYPLYTQLVFALDRVVREAPAHPEWKDDPVFKAIVAHDAKALLAHGKDPVLKLLGTANTGMTVAEYDREITAWIASARDRRFHQPYTSLVYVPMQELLAYLRDNGFRTFIVSGGGVEFMRPWTEKAYGIPPSQVIGSVVDVEFRMIDGRPELLRLPKVEFVDDGPGKPVGIYRAIGQRPIFAFGNSDGDLQMLQYTAGGDGLRFMGLVHHTDAVREYAYDRASQVGRLDQALDWARAHHWTVVDMKADWNRIFAF
ncbi:MAG: haloacid dehalogenase-like hydrolase [Proteobacteria bacterium]|nr:haloacid dehalogenase-like hydrolase [Pseudomonadota bacterium]